ncbi:uncharacterized protein PFL1_02954 [Pseudozyma flocculosa PF-1]|uniref:Mitochondrial distribution and morphology protein 34 n=1 Tax=Pseudozyma flocculosa PF-1 TaxID=1277687 RepID=A0A061HB91_9BASI|nr:uncharacterized protein PFL1_02954 [Pseudozyma flocculosa PF-1]EPQ29734.1 hypothetical protein PFL1_02954 [Pseudozyma flocculosa PF-1]
MSFNFTWPTFSNEFHESAAQMLDSALNKGPKPKVIADDIKVEELGMGTIPPELEILEIGDLGTDRFRGIFRLTYAGDAHLVLKTKVQANPLSKPNRPDLGLFPSTTASRGILFAAAPLVVPMHLRLSHVKLRAIVVLVVSKQKGITLVFKNDPLESVQVSSTFDSVAVLAKYLQQEIETQLREMFREDLPGIIHRLSQRWLSGEAKHEREEARLRSEGQQQHAHANSHQHHQANQTNHKHNYRQTPLPRSTSDPHGHFETASAPGGRRGHGGAPLSSTHTTPRPRSARRKTSMSAGASASGAPPRKTPPVSPPTASRSRSATPRRPRHSAKAASMSAAPLFNELLSSSASSAFTSSFPDIENYDPTYGLRPDDLPTHSGFSGLGKLAQRVSGGLRDLTSPPEVGPGGGSFVGQDRRADRPDPSGIDTDTSDPAGAALDSDGYTSHDDGDDDEDDLSHDGDAGAVDDDDDGDDDDGDDVSDSVLDDDDEIDDVPDLDLDNSADYTRFGYPPASAAFSDTHEVNRASSIIFDDAPAPGTSASSAAGGGAGSLSRRGGRRRAGSIGRPSEGGGSLRSTRTSSSSSRRRAPAVEYETIPAVGGGTVTRPRVYHIASKVQPPEVDWDDESTARPSQYGGGGGSSRTGGATRYGSEMGSTTLGGGPGSSRTNTVRGLGSPMLEGQRFPMDGSSEESLMELPPESMHSSDRSQHRMPQHHAAAYYGGGGGWRSGSSASASSASLSARQSSSGRDSGLYSSGLPSRADSLSRYTNGGWDYSGASSAPTSLPTSGLGSASDLGFQQQQHHHHHHHQRNGHDDADQRQQDSAGGIGIRLSKGKNVARPRPTAAASLDRAGFVTASPRQSNGGSGGSRWSQHDTPSRSTALASSPDLSTSGPHNDGGGRGGDLSTSPFSQRDLLSTSPSFHGSSPRSHYVSGASHALQQAAGAGGSGSGAGGAAGTAATTTTKLSIDASAHFADLVKSNHTLSPFTRSMEHFTVRSAPVTPGGWQHGGGGGGSVVGSAANSSHSAASGSGTGSGGSQAAMHPHHHHHHGHGHGHGQRHQHSQSQHVHGAATAPAAVRSAVGRSAAAASAVGGAQTDSPARRRRTFQLGGGGSGSGSGGSNTPSSSPQIGNAHTFAPAAATGTAAAGQGGFAALNAARWEAIRE